MRVHGRAPRARTPAYAFRAVLSPASWFGIMVRHRGSASWFGIVVRLGPSRFAQGAGAGAATATAPVSQSQALV